MILKFFSLILFLNATFMTDMIVEAATSVVAKTEKNEYCDNVGPVGRYWSTFAFESRKQFPKGKKVPTFVITSWFERLGNHFIQIHRALRYAVCCRGRLEIKYHNANLPKLKRYLDFSSKAKPLPVSSEYISPAECSSGLAYNFFLQNHDIPEPDCYFDEYAAMQYIIFGNEYSYGCISPEIRCPSGLDSTLVVHIRSGDIFADNPHAMYRQPPVLFYKQVFQSREWDRIVLVTSLERNYSYNPVWNYLLDRENADRVANTTLMFQISTSLEDDFKLMWCSRYFVAASSTLSNMIVWTGPYLKEVFGVKGSLFGSCGAYYRRHKAHKIKCHEWSLPGYYSADWLNTRKQRDQIITYNNPNSHGH